MPFLGSGRSSFRRESFSWWTETTSLYTVWLLSSGVNYGKSSELLVLEFATLPSGPGWLVLWHIPIPAIVFPFFRNQITKVDPATISRLEAWSSFALSFFFIFDVRLFLDRAPQVLRNDTGGRSTIKHFPRAFSISEFSTVIGARSFVVLRCVGFM